MAENNEKGLKLRCPECFHRDVDVVLAYDESNAEYYCKKCCYTGKKTEVHLMYEFIKSNRYKTICK